MFATRYTSFNKLSDDLEVGGKVRVPESLLEGFTGAIREVSVIHSAVAPAASDSELGRRRPVSRR